ncbi:MAG: NAD-dependent epimerase/dehydratase family protein [Nannocystaceae bacterium]|nr:NAD-dependent epimerase/dehydratase family protein [bacterium]
METQQHTIFGAGQVGKLLAAELAAMGHRVRLVRRGPAGEPMAGVQWLQGDATDPDFAARACEGSTSVYNCTNPPDYGHWDGVLQPLYRGVWDAAAAGGARLVQLENLYMYGRPAAHPFDEHTPKQPCAPHGALRKALGEELWARHAAGELEVTVGHASDFFGPGAHLSTVIRPDVIEGLRRGRRVYVTGNVDTPHGYTYTPDVARGLAILGTRHEAIGRAWHLPTTATSTTRAFLEAFADQLGTTAQVTTVPGWALRAVGLFSPMVAALATMRYQWDVPYVPDDSAFRAKFGLEPTPLHEAIEATLRAFTTQPQLAAA